MFAGQDDPTQILYVALQAAAGSTQEEADHIVELKESLESLHEKMDQLLEQNLSDESDESVHVHREVGVQSKCYKSKCLLNQSSVLSHLSWTR